MTNTIKTKKRRLFVIKCGRSCPLTGAKDSNSILVYSFLVYRLRMGKGDARKGAVSIAQIERGTRLDRKIIAVALEVLRALQLACECEDRWAALGPVVSDWFRKRKTNKTEWYDQFAYFPIEIPEKNSGLTNRQNLLYWSIVANPDQKQAYYALTLGLSSRTAMRGVKKLKSMGLLSDDGLRAVERTDELLCLWADSVPQRIAIRTRKPAAYELAKDPGCYLSKFPVTFKFEIFCEVDESTAHERFVNRVNENGRSMLQANYTSREIVEVWNHLISDVKKRGGAVLQRWEVCVMQFPWIFQRAEDITAKNRALGKFNGRNSRGVLDQLIKEAIDTLELWQGDLLFWSYAEFFPTSE